MDMTGMHGYWFGINVVANLSIVAGYVLVPFTVLHYLKLTTPVQLSGVFFFLTCAITHLSMAFQFSFNKFMVINHLVQAVSVIWFVLGFWELLREAEAAKQLNEPLTPPQPPPPPEARQ